MTIVIYCQCGRELERFERGPEASVEAFLAAHEADVRSYECDDAFVHAVVDTGAVDHLDQPIMIRVAGPSRRVVVGCGAGLLKRTDGHVPPGGKTRQAHAAKVGRTLDEPTVAVRGAGGVEAGRGRWSELRQLHDEHAKRGGKFDRPEPRKPAKRGKPPGTVTYHGVEVPPGTVREVGGWRVDTTDPDNVHMTPLPSDQPAKIPPANGGRRS